MNEWLGKYKPSQAKTSFPGQEEETGTELEYEG